MSYIYNSQEVRAVERRVLLETLASQLPPETIKFSSKLKTIQSNANGDTQLELEDGSELLAKVLFLSSTMTRNYMLLPDLVDVCLLTDCYWL